MVRPWCQWRPPRTSRVTTRTADESAVQQPRRSAVQEPLSSASTSAREYANWAAAQSVPIISGNYQRDLNSVELHPWDNINGRGVLLNHDRSVDSNDCWVVEIAPGSSLREEKHLFETMIYVLSGE